MLLVTRDPLGGAAVAARFLQFAEEAGPYSRGFFLLVTGL